MIEVFQFSLRYVWPRRLQRSESALRPLCLPSTNFPSGTPTERGLIIS